MRKTRILIANDASCLGTGYSVYGKELLTRLHKTGKYEIAEIGCYVDLDNTHIKEFPWKIYPNSPSQSKEPKEHEEYMRKPSHQFGEWRFHEICLHFEPDIVLDMRDYWMYAFEEVSPFRHHYKWVVMPTVDSAPQKADWLYTFANMDVVIPYTEWAKATLSNQCGKKINLFPDHANAGVDLKKFFPQEDKKKSKLKLFDRNVSVTGTVMRNQKRKLFPDLFKAYRLYLDRLIAEGRLDLYNESVLLLHTSYPEAGGWDFTSLLLEHRLLDKVYMTKICRKCQNVTIEKFHQGIDRCKACKTTAVVCPSAGSPIPTEKLVEVYNAMDLFMQVAICEGFGMPQVEAAACGVPIASVDYSAMSEIVRNLEGYPIRVEHLFREKETGADRASPSVENIAEIIYDHHVEATEEEKTSMSLRSRELCEKYYSWDGVADVWERAIDFVDISTNIPWSKENPNKCDPSNKVPADLLPAEFIEYIVLNIINEPYLLSTAPIRELIKNFGMGFQTGGKDGQPETYDNVINILNGFLNKKNVHEQFKKQKQKIFEKEYLNG